MNLPESVASLLEVATRARAEDLAVAVPPAQGGRAAAVLMLFWQDPEHGLQVLLIERSSVLRSHAGQPAFPGGAVDPEDVDAAAAALRETVEETGLDPSGVDVLATLPDLYIPVSGYVVSPVLAWWRVPSPVHAVDAAEVAAVHAVRVDDLLDPVNRLQVKHRSGFVGPAFRVNGMLVWGFTAALLDRLLRLVGWERPWSRDHVADLPDDVVRLALRSLDEAQAAALAEESG